MYLEKMPTSVRSKKKFKSKSYTLPHIKYSFLLNLTFVMPCALPIQITLEPIWKFQPKVTQGIIMERKLLFCKRKIRDQPL